MSESDFERAKSGFLSDTLVEKAGDTHDKYKSVLNVFEIWFENSSLDSLAELDSSHLHDFKRYCRDDRNNKKVSLNGTMSFLKVFLSYCEEINVVTEGLSEDVPTPSVPEKDEVCYDMPDDDHMEAALEYYRTHKPTSRTRIELELAAEGLLRQGAMRAIDEKDHDPQKRTLRLRHRPEEEEVDWTTLKNGTNSHRLHNISERLNTAICEYKEQKKEVEDKYNRKPLLATSNGRPRTSTIRRDFYKAMRPCEIGLGCPHDREIEDCEATKAKHASKCPSTYSPHPVRRWGIVNHLDQGVPIEKTSEKSDVSLPVLKKHYDPYSEKREQEDRKKSMMKHHDAFDHSENNPESEPANQEEVARRPLDVLADFFRSQIGDSIVIQWFLEDIQASRKQTEDVIQNRVRKGVATYCIFVVLLEVSTLLVSVS